MRLLLVPGNNSLSHVAKCLALTEALEARGHEVRTAVSRKHSSFLTQLSIEHAVLPDIQENDDSGFPSVEWFRDPRSIVHCVNAEVSLLEEYQPDRVLGVFRFTLKSSAALAGVPYDSLLCGCMLPESREVLGFAPDEPGCDNQRIILDGFFRYAGSKLGRALGALGLEKTSGDIRNNLRGERTFLWDFPEFVPLPATPGILHVGPVSWSKWPYDPVDIDSILSPGRPLAVLSFGTCTVCLSSTRRIIRVLIDLGYAVLLAAGGQRQFLNLMPPEPYLTIRSFAPLPKLLPHASLLVTHGGQLTMFEALQNRVPVVVMPFQPEQAHNGVCLERMGCGIRLVPPQTFQGNSRVYIDALEKMTDDDIRSKIAGLVNEPALSARLDAAVQVLRKYTGAEALATAMTEF
jgi:UDP:flavonoid glycosyltransferase YjiC (YdhE family)